MAEALTTTRPADTAEIVRQITKWDLLAISGGRVRSHESPAGFVDGITLPVSAGYAVEITLDWSDTYTVRRVRRGVVDFEHTMVYAFDLSEVAYKASCFF